MLLTVIKFPAYLFCSLAPKLVEDKVTVSNPESYLVHSLRCLIVNCLLGLEPFKLNCAVKV